MGKIQNFSIKYGSSALPTRQSRINSIGRMVAYTYKAQWIHTNCWKQIVFTVVRTHFR